MSDRELTRSLRDISNTLESSSADQNSSHNSNVFKRLSTSPSKKYPNDLSKPPVRISPVKRSPNKQTHQSTPKRLHSPDCLRNYVSDVTQSMDRPHFKKHNNGGNRLEENGPITNLVFSTSPSKVTFSNEKKIGGDGSLSKIRSRFSNGLLSPQRMSSITHAGLSPSELKGRNLFGKLKDEDLQDGSIPSITRKNTEVNASMQHRVKLTKKQPRKKSVTFELPHSSKCDKIEITDQLEDMTKLLSKILQQQKEMERRLTALEEEDK